MLDDKKTEILIKQFELINEVLTLLQDAVIDLHNRISAIEND